MSLETEAESVAELALADTDVNWDRFISCAQFTILSPFSLYALNKDDCFRPIWVLLGHYSLVPYCLCLLNFGLVKIVVFLFV